MNFADGGAVIEGITVPGGIMVAVLAGVRNA